MLKYPVVRVATALAVALLALGPLNAGAAGVAWESWKGIKGVFDADGPRTDGTLVVAGVGALYLVDAQGNQTDFARGPGGYHEASTSEQYLAVSHGGAVSAAGCSFTPDETFVLRLRVPLGLIRVSATGEDSGSFANLTGASSLNGLAFDNTGSFDHRLLVTGPASGKTTVFAVDCKGAVTTITKNAPVAEGGLAVAPSTFGAFAGDLIAPDELSGKIYGIAPSGTATVIAKPSLPTGGDIGVESVGFVPAGFTSRGGAVYYADRATPGNPHPGTDTLLRISSADLAAAGVQDGDMLAVTEGGATMVAVRCASTCTLTPVVTTATRAHGEGHVVFTLNPPPPSPSPVRDPAGTVPQPLVPLAVVDFVGTWGIPLGVVVLLAAVGAVFGVRALRSRGR